MKSRTYFVCPRFAIAALTGFFSSLGLGCSSVSKPVPEAAVSEAPVQVEKTSEPNQKPFMFEEADLPVGFPPPGPVDVVMVKEYPAYRLARITQDAMKSNGRADADGMFVPLFKHIQRNNISMTSPVEMSYKSAEDGKQAVPEAMAFLYGSTAIGKDGIDPGDARIKVIEVPASTWVSIGVRGGYNARNFAAALAKLNQWIAQNPGKFSVLGEPRYLAYNSPFVPGFLRMGEVQLRVEIKQDTK